MSRLAALDGTVVLLEEKVLDNWGEQSGLGTVKVIGEA